MERELWKLLYWMAVKLDNPWGGWKYSTAEIVGVYLWSVVNDRPMDWSVDQANWPPDLGLRRLPPQSTLSRRMKHSFSQSLYRFRRQIERDFGNLVSFGGGLTCLPAWVRRFTRVRNWVQAKLLVNAARWFKNHPDVLALA